MEKGVQAISVIEKRSECSKSFIAPRGHKLAGFQGHIHFSFRYGQNLVLELMPVTNI